MSGIGLNLTLWYWWFIAFYKLYEAIQHLVDNLHETQNYYYHSGSIYTNISPKVWFVGDYNMIDVFSPGFDRSIPGFDRSIPGFDRFIPGFDRFIPASIPVLEPSPLQWPALQRSCKGGILVSPCPSVRLWTKTCPLGIFNNTRRTHLHVLSSNLRKCVAYKNEMLANSLYL